MASPTEHPNSATTVAPATWQRPARVIAAQWTPTQSHTGTDPAAVSLVNKGRDGEGTTVIARVSLSAGVTFPATLPITLTLSGTPANLEVTAGDTLAFESEELGNNLEGLVSYVTG